MLRAAYAGRQLPPPDGAGDGLLARKRRIPFRWTFGKEKHVFRCDDHPRRRRAGARRLGARETLGRADRRRRPARRRLGRAVLADGLLGRDALVRGAEPGRAFLAGGRLAGRQRRGRRGAYRPCRRGAHLAAAGPPGAATGDRRRRGADRAFLGLEQLADRRPVLQPRRRRAERSDLRQTGGLLPLRPAPLRRGPRVADGRCGAVRRRCAVRTGRPDPRRGAGDHRHHRAAGRGAPPPRSPVPQRGRGAGALGGGSVSQPLPPALLRVGRRQRRGVDGHPRPASGLLGRLHCHAAAGGGGGDSGAAEPSRGRGDQPGAAPRRTARAFRARRRDSRGGGRLASGPRRGAGRGPGAAPVASG